MHVLTVGNRKGGVGKTSAAVHLAATIGRRGADVVLIDLDSQANATTILTNPDAIDAGDPTTAEVFSGDVSLAETLRPTNSPGVRLAPASRRLVAAQLMLADKLGRESILARALEGLKADLVVIDTGPDGHWAAANALVASTHVAIPFISDPLSIQGLLAVELLVGEVRRQRLNPELEVVGALQVAADRRVKITGEIRKQASKYLGATLLDSVIRENSRFQTCGAWHRDVLQLEGGGDRRGTEDYASAADEILLRLEHKGGKVRAGRRVVA